MVPATYSPIARPAAGGSTSSPMWPIATATTPARARPTSTRVAIRTQNAGLTPPAATAAQATARATVMTRVRPARSARPDMGSTVRPTSPVVTDTVRLAAVGPTPKAAPIEGSSACVE